MYTAISPSPFLNTKHAPYVRVAGAKKRRAKATAAVAQATLPPLAQETPLPTPLVPATTVPKLPQTSWKRVPLSTASKRKVLAIGAISTVRADLRKKFKADEATFQEQ